jgi:uncharacterized protein YxeA
MAKKILKIAIAITILLLLVLGGFYIAYNEPLPEKITATVQEADDLANKMLEAVRYADYKNTRYLEWSFQNGKNRYKWDREKGTVVVEWGDHTVDLDLKNPQNSMVWEHDRPVKKEKAHKWIQKAIANFNNDSFWLVAPFKVFDKGTQRHLVAMEDGSKGLLVTYTSGGTTPGDSYLWRLGPNAFPVSFKMWAAIVPVGGLEVSWDEWTVVESGAFLPQSHKFGPITLKIGDLRGYNE